MIMLTKSNSKKKRSSIFWAICTRSKNSEVSEPALNVFALSEIMHSGIPLLLVNLLKALKNALAVWSSTNSRCTARIDSNSAV